MSAKNAHYFFKIISDNMIQQIKATQVWYRYLQNVGLYDKCVDYIMIPMLPNFILCKLQWCAVNIHVDTIIQHVKMKWKKNDKKKI